MLASHNLHHPLFLFVLYLHEVLLIATNESATQTSCGIFAAMGFIGWISSGCQCQGACKAQDLLVAQGEKREEIALLLLELR